MTEITPPAIRDRSTLWNAICSSKRGFEPALMIPERLVFPDSWAGHLPFASWIMAVSEPKRFVELGVHTGNSYCTFAQAVTKYQLNTECFGVDHWFGDEQAGLYGEDVYADLKQWHDPRFGHFSRLMRMSFADGLEQIDDRSVDLLHIDGLHTYEAVREDFETYLPKMSKRCIVMFHDTTVFREDFGVWKYFREIKEQYPTFEFLHSNGLGVAYTGSEPLENLDPLLAALFTASDDEGSVSTFRAFFALLGDAHIRSIRLDDKQRWGEEILKQLHDVNLELGAVCRDRAALAGQLDTVLTEREGLIEKAIKWDQLAVNTGGAIGLDLAEINDALNALYNSSNPQALKDRDTLKHQFSNLIEAGTFKPDVLEIVARSLRWIRGKASGLKNGAPDISRDESIEQIRESGLFDPEYYALTSKAVNRGQDPLEHYLQEGEAQGFAPSASFDPSYYARRNPDVAKSGYGLLRHFVDFGLGEDRPCVTPARRMKIPSIPKAGGGRVLLLVEPKLTTAQFAFLLNLAHHLKESMDILLLLQPENQHAEIFAQKGLQFVEFPHETDMEAIDRNEVLQRIVEELKPDFAIALSLASRINIRGLAAAGLGVVQLVDEYSSAVHPFGSAYEFLPWAHRLVFPSESVAWSFENEHSYLARRQKDVLWPPISLDFEDESECVNPDVLNAIRSKSDEDCFVVLGAGNLVANNGLETFLSLAFNAGGLTPNGRILKFVWVVSNKTSCPDDGTLRSIRERIRCADLQDRVTIVPVDSGLASTVQSVDLFVQTGELDARSDLALSAAKYGKAILCFENSSTIADILSSSDETAKWVLPCFDVPALACAVIQLADNHTQFQNAVTDIQTLARRRLKFCQYVRDLVRIGEQAKLDAGQISADYKTVSSAGQSVFNEKLFKGVWSGDKYPQDYLHTYLLRSKVSKGIDGPMPPDLRRPVVGFNPLIYFEDNMSDDSQRDPLVEWSEGGRLKGRWTHQVIELDSGGARKVEISALLHAHFYYVDLIDDFLQRLASNISNVDLVITVPDAQKAEFARTVLENAQLRGSFEVVVVRNLGRDIGPFLTGLNRELLQKYDIIGHVHGKKSPHVDPLTGDTWRNFLWEHIIGGQAAAIDSCLAAFKADENLGLVFPEDPHLIGWDANWELATELCQKMGRTEPLPRAFEWPIGNMFWARRNALQPLFDIGLDWSDYPAEPLPEDGTLLHAIERCIPFAVAQAGFGYASTHLPEVQR